MAGNTFGTVFKISTFGESHGRMIGVTIDGCPSGVPLDLDFIQSELDRRKPGQSKITTDRKEKDHAEVISGLFEGKSTGTPIGIVIQNLDQRSDDYAQNIKTYRPSHADFTYDKKYGTWDHRGGGRASARETAVRVAAGAVAKLLLKHYGISVYAYVSQVADICIPKEYTLNTADIEKNLIRCPHAETAEKMIKLIEAVKADGDSVGGVVSAVITGCPAGLGEPVYDKLQADLAKAMMSINAAKGFDYGSGYGCVLLKGSEHNDAFAKNKQGEIITLTNHSGGIQGGISNGMPIDFTVAFKPVSTILQPRPTVNQNGDPITLQPAGRHDPCVLPRVVPVVEAMAAITIADHLLRNRLAKLKENT